MPKSKNELSKKSNLKKTDSSSIENKSSNNIQPQTVSKRIHQVKVTLNSLELGKLDELVKLMSTDRSSFFRHLLSYFINNKSKIFKESDQNDYAEELLNSSISKMQNSFKISFFQPLSFDEIPPINQAICEGKAVVLNLVMMDPDEAQRSVDFVAGGTFSVGGSQERLGESIFLFTPFNGEIINNTENNENFKVGIDKKSEGSFPKLLPHSK